jgi:hypothetical protein
MNETKELTRIINRHKARLLRNLEDASCPMVYKDAVKTAYDWMRSDVQGLSERNEGEHNDEAEDRFNR